MGTVYQKPFMSISELVELGLPKEYLKNISTIADAPIIRTGGNGKIIFRTSDLDEFMDKVSKEIKSKRKGRRMISG